MIAPRILSRMYPSVTHFSFTLPKSHAFVVVVVVVVVVVAVVFCQHWHCHS